MPELPDLTAYLEAIGERALGRTLERLDFVSPFVLRSVDPAPAELAGRRLVGLARLGKRLVFELDGERFLVLHLMIAGRLQWKERAAKAPGRIALAALAFDSGTLWLTEAGSKKRASIHLVRGREALAAHDPGGIEPLAATPAAFRAALGSENRTLKRALTDPRLVAGIGNAYSDEILHAARLSPFLRTGDLADEAWDRLHAATVVTLTEWIERLRAERAGGFPAKVTAFRPEMAVHGRFGQPCPRCGAPVQRIVYAENEANYCAACQTGGRLLADRALSQLLRSDWPKTLDELEERKALARAASAAVRPLVFAATFLLAAASAPAAPVPTTPTEPTADRAAAAGPEARPRRDVEPVLPLPPREADPERLTRARSLLGDAARDGRVGPYRLLTDVADGPFFERAARVAAALDVIYRERYGLAPIGTPRETTIVFAREADYRRFQSAERGLSEIATASGLAGGGVAASYAEGRTDDELLATLVHEWTHLVSRRALGPALPSWLDEGIAEELGASAIDEAGTLRPGSWARRLRPRPSGWTIEGGEATLRELHEAPVGAGAGERSAGELERTLALDWERFAAGAPEATSRHYAVATAFLRLLFADRELAPRFRAWLADVASGAPPDADDLRLALEPQANDGSWRLLESRTRLFVEGQFLALEPLPPPEKSVQDR